MRVLDLSGMLLRHLKNGQIEVNGVDEREKLEALIQWELKPRHEDL